MLKSNRGAKDKKVAVVVCADGSQKTDNVCGTIGTGTAWVLQWKGKWLGKNGFSLGRHAKVYDAEVMRICGGVDTEVTRPMMRSVAIIHICTDNLNVAQQAGTIPNGSSLGSSRRLQKTG